MMDRKLVVDAFLNFLVVCEYFVADNFDGELSRSIQMPSFKDLAVGACAEKLIKFIFADNSAYLHLVNS